VTHISTFLRTFIFPIPPNLPNCGNCWRINHPAPGPPTFVFFFSRPLLERVISVPVFLYKLLFSMPIRDNYSRPLPLGFFKLGQPPPSERPCLLARPPVVPTIIFFLSPYYRALVDNTFFFFWFLSDPPPLCPPLEPSLALSPPPKFARPFVFSFFVRPSLPPH